MARQTEEILEEILVETRAMRTLMQELVTELVTTPQQIRAMEIQTLLDKMIRETPILTRL